MVTLESAHVAGTTAIVLLVVVAAYLVGKRHGRNGRNDRNAAHGSAVANLDGTGRADMMARLTPPSQATIGPDTAAGLSNEQLQERALDLAAQIGVLAAEWAGKIESGVPQLPRDAGVEERRTADRLGGARHKHATALYQRIRHEVIDVRTALLTRLDGRVGPMRTAGIDHVYEYQAGAQPFRDVADDLALLARLLDGK